MSVEQSAQQGETVMATAAAKSTDMRTRSIELAEARGYHGSGSAQSIGATFGADGQLVALAVRVPSASSDGSYTVGYLAARDDAECECEAARHGRACFHRGLAIRAGRYVTRRARLGWPED